MQPLPAFHIHIPFKRKWNNFGSTSMCPLLEFRWNENHVCYPQIANRRTNNYVTFMGLAEQMQIHPQFHFHKFVLSFFIISSFRSVKNVFLTNSKVQSIGGPNKLWFKDVIKASKMHVAPWIHSMDVLSGFFLWFICFF